MGTISLPPGEHTLDARAIVHGATSRCPRLREILRSGHKVSSIAADLYGISPGRQSRITLALGNTFESQAMHNNGERLIEAYRKRGLLTTNNVIVADYRKGFSHTEALVRVARHVEDRLAGRPSPNLIFGAHIDAAALGLPSAFVKPDLLIADSGVEHYDVGELKSYESRGGLTASEDIEGSAAQAAVPLALLQIAHRQYDAIQSVHIILRRPSSMTPVVHVVPARRDLDEIHKFAGFIAAAGDDLPHPPSTLSRELVEAIPNAYSPACLQSCDLAKACRANAIKCASPTVLGPEAEELFKPVGKLVTIDTPVMGEGYARERLRFAQHVAKDIAS